MPVIETPLDMLRVLLNRQPHESLREICESAHPAALAEVLSEMGAEEAVRILRFASPEVRAEVLGHLDTTRQQEFAELLTDDELGATISVMLSDDRVDLLQAMPEDRMDAILRRIAKAEREDILKLSSYPEGTAGAIMTSGYVALHPDLTVVQALDKVRQQAPDKETIYYVYVVDENRQLLGLVSLKDLVIEKPSARLEDIMYTDLVVAHAEDSQEDVAQKLSQYDLIAIPVINGNNALAGIVTFDDILDVAEEEATEDFHRMGAAGADIKASLKDASISLLYCKRIPWLLVLVFMNIFSGAGIAFFEETIEATVALVFFLPLLIDSGGNAGSQSATLMVRAIATGEVQLRDWLKLITKELFVALTLGISMGIAVSFISVYRAGPEVAVVVAVTMVAIVLVGSLIGLMLPLLLTALKLDPATASAPLVTSIADITGVLIYFGIATWYLGVTPPS